MSFILDALKKSEEERRKGEIPGLRDEPPPSASRRHPGWMILLTAALLINGLVLGWWLISSQEPVGAGSAREVRPQAAPPAAESAEPAKASAVTPAAAAPEDSQVNRNTNESAASREPKKTMVPEVAETGAGGSVAAATAEEVAREDRPSASARQAEAPRESAPPVEEQPPPARETSYEAAVVSTGTSAPSFPLLTDLSSSQRARLPEIRLQLHFYIDEPERRMIRVNGTNLREGEKTGEGIEVVGIDADGVRLVWQGIRLFLQAGG